DPHIHMTSRTTDDYQAMAAAGIAMLVEPAFWVGQPRTHVGTFEDYFLSLLGWERFRASQFGIRHYCTLAINPKEANDPALVNGAADWGVSDPLKVPKTRDAMRAAGIADATLERIFWTNPITFFAQSGRLDPADVAMPLSVDQRQLHEGNSVLRGQTPRVDS